MTPELRHLFDQLDQGLDSLLHSIGKVTGPALQEELYEGYDRIYANVNAIRAQLLPEVSP